MEKEKSTFLTSDYTTKLQSSRQHGTSTETDSWTEYRLVVAQVEDFGGGIEWEVRLSRCKLLYREWINNKVLLYSTETYMQYPTINHNGREYLKRMHIYV